MTRWCSIFLRAVETRPIFAPKVIAECCILHNLCLAAGDIQDDEQQRGGQRDEQEEEEDPDDEEEGDGDVVPLIHTHTMYCKYYWGVEGNRWRQ